MSIIDGEPTSDDYSRDRPEHTLHQPYDDGQQYFIPIGLEKTGQFFHRCQTVGAPLISTLHLVPEILDRVKVRALSWPVQSLDPIVTMPPIPNHGDLCNMTAGSGILKITCVHSVMLPKHIKRLIIQNCAIALGVECSRNCDEGSMPYQDKQPHTITPPPLNFVVSLMH